MGCQKSQAIPPNPDGWKAVISQGLPDRIFFVVPVTPRIKESVMNGPSRWTSVFDGVLPMVLAIIVGLVGIKGGLS